MIILPAIDLYDGKAVRLYKGDYNQMTVYSDNPPIFAREFYDKGATWMHLVDLEGAKEGTTPNLETIRNIVFATGLKVEVGGGIRNMETVKKYIDIGVSRVILGTAAVKDREFLLEAVKTYGDKIAVGVDIRDGFVAVKGWTESAGIEAFAFCKQMQEVGVSTLICTDISRDGAMQGANAALYRRLSQELSMRIIASGGVSSIDDVRALTALELYGAIIGKAYYTGAVSLRDVIEVAE